MDFLMQNEIRVNRLIVHIAGVAFLASFAILIGMKFVDLTVALWEEILEADKLRFESN